jgi:hypothetical protein
MILDNDGVESLSVDAGINFDHTATDLQSKTGGHRLMMACSFSIKCKWRY